jgi:hypothetical protein
MLSAGLILTILGFGSLLLPVFGLQFKLLSLLDGAQPWIGILIGLVGLALLVVGFMQNNNQEGQQQP